MTDAKTINDFINYVEWLKECEPILVSNPNFAKYLSDFEKYIQMPYAESRMGFWPCLDDDTSQTKLDPYYFYQDTWAAGKVFDVCPRLLVDVGSTALLVGILAKRFKTVSVDIRPLSVSLPNLECLKGSITTLPFKNGSIEMLSSICVLEHVGLGRYGDSLDSLGSLKAFDEISRVIRPGGHFLVSLPVSHTSGVLFNAHRIFNKEQVLGLLPDFYLYDELYLYPHPISENVVENLQGFQYCVWCAHLMKQ